MARSPLKVAFIGEAAFSKGQFSVTEVRDVLPPGCELVGLCDIREDAVHSWKKEAPELLITTDYRDIAAMDGCDVVCQFTPNAMHVDISMACLAGGKHVWMEKPIGVNLEEGRKLVDMWRKSDLHVAVDLEYRYSYLTGGFLKDLLGSGEIGTLLHIEYEHWRGGWTLENAGNIYRTKKAFSGQMRMEGVHTIDYFRYLCGEIAAVQGFAAPNALPHYEFPDNLNVILWFESGVMGNYRANHTRSAFDLGESPLEGPRAGHTARFGITGTKGSVICDLWASEVKIFHFIPAPQGTAGRKVTLDRIVNFGLRKDWFSGFHDMSGYRRDFLTRLAEGRPPLQTLEDAWRSEIIACLCEESAERGGEKIDVTAGLNRYFARTPAGSAAPDTGQEPSHADAVAAAV